MALVDAGIPLKGLVCACSAGFINDNAVVDVNHVEESQGGPELIVAVLPKTEQIVLLEMNGRLHEDRLSLVLDSAVKGCKDIFNVLDRSVRDQLTDLAASLGDKD